MTSRKTISNTLLQQQYAMIKEIVKAKINSAEAVVLTMDGWTSTTNESYLSVTAHYVKDLELASSLLECFKYDERHTSEKLSEELLRVTREWGIQEKVVCVVSDNAANIVGAIRLTAWKHIPCFAHTLNLIVQNGLPHIQPILNKVKKIVEFFKRSSQACTKLKKMQEQLKEPVLTLKQDTVTRWNSTYDMLRRIIEVKNSLMTVITLNYPDLPNLTAEDISSVTQACDLLKVFKDCTEEMSSENVVTASKDILLSRSLKKWCCRFVNNTEIHVDVQQMAEKLAEDLKRRFRNIEENSIFAEATALDPRFKLHGFSDKNSAEKVKLNLIRHCEKFVTNTSTATATISVPTTESTSSLWLDFDEVFSRLQSNPHPRAAAIVEVDKYLQEPLLQRQGNPLQWWSERLSVYPSLFELAKLRLCIVATSTPCERVFSKAGHLITDRRNRLTGKKVEQIMFLNGNL
ncbi:E3 SUMO-protein ligase ZBED1-like [Schistocerca nitens]|uniref:E3 SUMO-protein ligase ZBED1-like n=1 Tax=Schistocerca nitens TaxID=7011 RepID=UPI0021193CDE|nr:E3 SUMO-protein ligase ZBED1-like [Schistocerca nitens]